MESVFPHLLKEQKTKVTTRKSYCFSLFSALSFKYVKSIKRFVCLPMCMCNVCMYICECIYILIVYLYSYQKFKFKTLTYRLHTIMQHAMKINILSVKHAHIQTYTIIHM